MKRKNQIVRIIKTDIILCPECFPRIKTFKKDKDLNIHLKLKHNSKYKILIQSKITIKSRQ